MKMDKISWEKELNTEQLTAVNHWGAPLLVLAGAGSGKTRVLTYRVAWLIQKKTVPAENILLLTFTNKAAGEMKERVHQLIGYHPGFAGTFHSFCARILRRYGTQVGLDPNFVIYDEDDRLQAIKMAMKELQMDTRTLKAPSVAAAISSAKNEMLTASEYLNFARGGFQEQVGRIWTIYQANLKKYQAVDFDDLLLLGVRLLQVQHSTTGPLSTQYQQVLVDEYQDTNKAQYQLTRLLVSDRPGLTVVGDFSQSIYSWRGADFRNLFNLERDYPNLVTVKLQQNYRSTQNILDAAYGVIGHNTTHPILHLESTLAQGEPVQLYQAFDEKDEARFVTGQLVVSNHLGKSAILYRTNAQSRAIEEDLIRQGIPYTLIGGTKFYERREIKDLLAFLRVISNPADEVSWQRIDKVGKRRRAIFEQWLRTTQETQPNFKSWSTEELLHQVLTATDYLSLYDEHDENDLMRLENIKELGTVAREFTSLEGFLENVALVQSEMTHNLDYKKEAVTLMTIHAAKGLEFDFIYLIGLEEGLFPHSRALMDREQMEEERRLCYVALTRAKKRLFLVYAQNRLYFGQRGAGTPSRFIMEIPSHLLQMQAQKRVTDRPSSHHFDSPDLPIVNKNSKPVSDWELAKATMDDFADIDSW